MRILKSANHIEVEEDVFEDAIFNCDNSVVEEVLVSRSARKMKGVAPDRYPGVQSKVELRLVLRQ